MTKQLLIGAAATWLVLGLLGPGWTLAVLGIGAALAIGIAGWLIEGDHVTIERDE